MINLTPKTWLKCKQPAWTRAFRDRYYLPAKRNNETNAPFYYISMAGLTIAFNDSIMQHELDRSRTGGGEERACASQTAGQTKRQQHVSVFRKQKKIRRRRQSCYDRHSYDTHFSHIVYYAEKRDSAIDRSNWEGFRKGDRRDPGKGRA